MAIQVSYPGVYIDEFAPGAPIQGVGTSTAGFVGTATKGPSSDPTLVQSWDAFVREFGDFPKDSPPAGYLAHGVYGFFSNGGTAAYIVRASTGVRSAANLVTRGGGAPAMAVARANDEGLAGDNIAIAVSDTSLVQLALAASAPAHTIAGVAGATVTLAPATTDGFAVGEAIALTGAAGTQIAIIKGFTATAGEIVLQQAPLAAPAIANGDAVAPAAGLAVWRAATDVSPVANAKLLTVVSSAGFRIGDRVSIKKGNAAAILRTITDVPSPTTVIVDSPLTLAAAGATATMRSDDISPGAEVIRVSVPSSVNLASVLPRGAVITIAIAGGNSETAVVESSSGNTITLQAPLTKTYNLNPANLNTLPLVTSLEFDVSVTAPSLQAPEQFLGLSTSPEHPSYWRRLIVSMLLAIDDPAAPFAPAADPRPAAQVYNLAGGMPDDRNAAWQSVLATPARYLDTLKRIDQVAIVAIPGATDKFVQQSIVAHCIAMYDRFAILDSVRGHTPQKMNGQFADVAHDKGFAALYYPWIKTRHPKTGREELWPPSGHLAGVFARTDQLRGVHKAPANANVRGAFDVELRLTDQEQGPLNLTGVNVIRVFPESTQPMVWGARTVATDRNWMYVNIRRLFIYLEESIEEGIRWAVFEPNDLALWQKLRRTIVAFLTQVWRDGALFGATAEEAFYVRIDEALNPPSTRKLGRLYIEIGLQPTYPAEFIIVRIGIWDGGSETNES